jgi:hypothetical protein
MKHSKDLNWLSAPAFFLILGILAFQTKKQSAHNRKAEKTKMENTVLMPQKQS